MFAAIYIPDFPVEAIVRAEPELREQAVAVVEGAPPLVRVVAVNEWAAQAGVEPGMTRLQAEERLGNGPTLSRPKAGRDKGGAATPAEGGRATLRVRSAEREAAAHAALLDCACGFSPRVEATAPDTALLDLAGLERICGPPAKIARDVARRCSELGLEASVAVGSNPDAALLAARGFPGVTVIPPGQEAERLGGLPIDVLLPMHSPQSCSRAAAQTQLPIADCRLPIAGAGQSEILNLQSEIFATLERWGIRNLRALAALPEVAVSERLGQEGLRLQKLARGATSRPLLAMEPPLTFEEAIELDYPVGELEPLSFLLNRMLEQLCARLAARALAANEVKVRLELDCGIAELRNCRIEDGRQISAIPQSGNSAVHERTLRLPVPMLEAKVFLKLLQLDLQGNPPGAPVAKIWLSATPAEPRRAQDGLFLPAAPDAERLEVTLAKIKRVVGRPMADGRWSMAGDQKKPPAASGKPQGSEERVGSPELLDTHQSDAFTMKKFAPAKAEPSTIACPERSRGDHRPSTPLTALRLFRPPLAASVVLNDGRPARLACLERPTLRGDVTWCAGPWRSSGEWWSEQAWSRQEWDVSLGDVLYRIYRDTTGWFVEGSYD